MERSVQLISPSEEGSQLTSLISTLKNLGYKTQTSSIPLGRVATVSPPLENLLYLSNDVSLSRVLSQLGDSEISLQLVVFEQGVPWDRKILDHCLNLMTWPCMDSELSFRLECAFSTLNKKDNVLLSDIFMQVNMIGQAPSFIHALSVIKRIAQYRTTVLISGETGTGKELAARAIHYFSDDSDAPFVPVNCGGIPDELFENELFGHLQGAYTDAKGKQCGYVEQAEGGTLFLDEIDALSMKAQTTLLRLLQDQTYKPLGSEKVRYARTRIIAATNANLSSMVNTHQFRQDLLFRLDVLSLKLPSLKERPGDAIRLAEHFILKFSREYAKPPRPLHPAFIAWLEDYHWPGNIRELENTILRAFLLSDGGYVSGEDSYIAESEDSKTFGKFNDQKALAIAGFERHYLERLLIETHGNISLAAKLAGKERRALGKLLQKYGINRIDYVHDRH